MAVRDGIPYAIDFCNPAPDADIKSVGQENFDWVVEHASKMAIERAHSQKPGKDNLTWGTFVRNSIASGESSSVKAKPATKPAAKKAPLKESKAKKK
jgi:hypothetical protein